MATSTALYYTCNVHQEDIEMACRRQLLKASGGCELISVSLKPIDFGDMNIVLNRRRSPESMHYQIVAGLEQAKAGYVFLCESDVLYHEAHFVFTPPRDDIFYYNTNVWRLRFTDGHAIWTDDLRQVSGYCASRDLLLEHYRKRIARIEAEGKYEWKIGFEPGAHPPPRGIDNGVAEPWMAEFPNIDIRHDKTMTVSRWSPDQFRQKKYTQGWKETDGYIAGWGTGMDILRTIRGDTP